LRFILSVILVLLALSIITSFYSPPWLGVLSQYPNVAAVLVNEDHYFAGSPLQDWYEKGQWLKSPHLTQLTVEMMRLLAEEYDPSAIGIGFSRLASY
jgi:hypothetical protein